jgi:anti-sigma regulatory factor (Ser/Thr protein kinase)
MAEEDKILTVPRSMNHIHNVSDAIYDEALIQKYNLSEEDKELFFAELKILIYELFSNSVNHTQGDTIIIRYNLSPDEFKISTEGIGRGFKIKPTDASKFHGISELYPPFPEKYFGSEVAIYKDSDYSVKCFIVSDNTLTFHVHPSDLDPGKLSEVNEHYGIFFISSIADEVKYEFLKGSKEIFSVKLNIKNFKPRSREMGGRK